jgi:hypothetical protein
MKKMNQEEMTLYSGGEITCGEAVGLVVGLIASQVLLGFVTAGLTWYTAGITFGYGGAGVAVACGSASE